MSELKRLRAENSELKRKLSSKNALLQASYKLIRTKDARIKDIEQRVNKFLLGFTADRKRFGAKGLKTIDAKREKRLMKTKNYIAKHPKANPKQIAEALKQSHKITVSTRQVIRDLKALKKR